MKLDKLSLQFALHETDHAESVLEAYERLIHDAMSGDQTLFTNAEGIERLWEVSHPLLDAPPRSSSTGSARGGRRQSTTSSPRGRGVCPSSGAGASTRDDGGSGRGSRWMKPTSGTPLDMSSCAISMSRSTARSRGHDPAQGQTAAPQTVVTTNRLTT